MVGINLEYERNIKYQGKDIIYFDIDYLLNVEGVNKLSGLEFNYVKIITHIFIGNLGFGKTWRDDGLDKLRELFNLKYNEINFKYKGKEYKIKVSNKTNKHGKILGFKSYTLSFDRPNPEPINDFDILLDMRWLKSLKNNKEDFINYFDKEIGSHNMKDSNIKIHRLFLDYDFKLDINEVLGNLLSYDMISKQEGYVVEELEPLLKILTDNGYYYKVHLNNEDVKNAYSMKLSGDLRMKVKVYDTKSNKESVAGSYLLLETFINILWNIYLDFFVVSTLKGSKNRNVTIKKHLKY